MAIEDDISVAVNGDIRYTGTTSNYSVLEIHRFLSDLQDNSGTSGDDLTDITDSTASSRSTDNIITLNAPYNIDDTMAQHCYGGSITQDNGDTVYSGLQIIGSFTAEPSIIQNNTKLTGYWGTSYNPNPTLGIAIDIIVKTRTGGADIDGKRARVQTRDFGNQYREASTVLGLGSVPAAPGSIQNDPFNNTAIGTIAALSGITNTEGYQLIDIGDGNGNQSYYSQWDRGANSANDLYEWIKWATRDGSTETLYGLNGELFRGVTHEIAIDTPTGTFNSVEPVSWSGGTGQMLAIDSTTAGTKMWMQLLTGVVPADGQTLTGGTSSATADVNVTVTERPRGVESVSGNFTGAWLGAFGVGFNVDDLSASDSVVDLDGDTNTPPNNVTFSVDGLVSTEDRVLVGPEDGSGGLDLDQLSLSTTLSSVSETSVVVTTTIPSDTPSTGTIRVLNDAGNYVLCTYTSFTGSTFTVNSVDFSSSNATAGNNVFISYIDKLADSSAVSFTSIYNSDRTLFIRVRDGGVTPIVPFETTGTLGSAGGSVTAIRQADV